MELNLGNYKAVLMTTDGSITVTDRLPLEAIRSSIQQRQDLLFSQVTRIVTERAGMDKPEVWEIVSPSALIVEEPEPPPTLAEQRDACRATATELLTSPGRDLNCVTQAMHWNKHADALQARIDRGES